MNIISCQRRSIAAFTLAELAIVMVIIGLLIGGVLKGMSLIENARVKSVMSQVKYIDGASAGYFEKFGAVPGDHIQAMTRLTGCNAAANCVNGNGNRQIGAPVADFTIDNQAGQTGLPQVETTMFWKHLALAEFIIDINTNANSSAPAWQTTHPIAKGFGGYSVLYVPVSNGVALQGHYVMLRKLVDGSASPTTEGAGAVKPSVAQQIDTAMDDGLPTGGSIRASGASCVDTATGGYNGEATSENCIMIFKIHTL